MSVYRRSFCFVVLCQMASRLWMLSFRKHIIWGHCCEICADGAGCHCSMMKQVKVVAVWKHCITHGKALVTKKMPEELQAFPVEAVNFVNLIKSGAITSCAFWGLMAARGKVLTFLRDLHKEVPSTYLVSAWGQILEILTRCGWCIGFTVCNNLQQQLVNRDVIWMSGPGIILHVVIIAGGTANFFGVAKISQKRSLCVYEMKKVWCYFQLI